jgi:hypothetical protein
MTTKEELEKGMYYSDRCLFCAEFGEKSKPYICKHCINKIALRLPELVEIDEAKLKEIIRTHTTYFLGSSWEAMGEDVRNNLARGISHSKGIIRIREK